MEVDFDFDPAPLGFADIVGASAVEYFLLMTDSVRAVLKDFAPFF